jgi:hypothetical protein
MGIVRPHYCFHMRQSTAVFRLGSDQPPVQKVPQHSLTVDNPA